MALQMYATGLREAPSPSCPGQPAPAVRQVDYTYDHFLNLAKQVKQFYVRDPASGTIQFDATCHPVTAAVSETYQHDELLRLLASTRSWLGDSA
jgi:hypothetical protein